MPHLYMPTITPLTRRIRRFYDLNEAILLQMAQSHFDQETGFMSGFSSWASSLHLVLCYARSMALHTDPHIAVIDTCELDVEVLVWHCPHLIGIGYEEYLAWGPIQGRGYKTVRFVDLLRCGVTHLFPQLRDRSYREKGDVLQFGNECRSRCFGRTPVQLTPSKIKAAEDIATLFGGLFLPVFVALLCLETRSWYKARSDDVIDVGLMDHLSRVVERKGLSRELEVLHGGNWLRPGQVDTTNFPDVQQWIGLLRALVRRRKLTKSE